MTYRDKRPAVRRVFDVPWTKAWEFGAHVTGYPRLHSLATVDVNATDVASYLASAYIQRITPMSCGIDAIDLDPDNGPDLPQRFLWATDFDVDGIKPVDFEEISQMGRYLWARVTVDFQAAPFRIRKDQDMPTVSGSPVEYNMTRYVTPMVNPYAQFVTLPAHAFLYVNDTNTADQVAVQNTNGVIQVFANVSYTWHEVPVIPYAALELLGKSNDATFGGFERETLNYIGCQVVPYRKASGQRVFDITYMMKRFKPGTDTTVTPNVAKGWNHVIRFSNEAVKSARTLPTYQRVSHNGLSTGDPIFPRDDFRKLFVPAGYEFMI